MNIKLITDTLRAGSEKLAMQTAAQKNEALKAVAEALDKNRASIIAENKKETLAQVFADIWYSKADNEYFSEVLLSVLRKQGFLK